MDQGVLRQLSQQLQIAPEQVAREEFELVILKDLVASPIGPALVFKGGTALRLAYGSPRFSDDLDFSLVRQLSSEQFVDIVNVIANRYPSITLPDTKVKHFTYFASFRVEQDFLPLPFRIKVEISKRKANWQESKDYMTKQLKSPVTNLLVLAKTITLERAYLEKQKLVKDRNQGRDIYDLWWLTSQLKRKFKLPKKEYSISNIRRDVNRLLPINERYILEEITKNI